MTTGERLTVRELVNPVVSATCLALLLALAFLALYVWREWHAYQASEYRRMTGRGFFGLLRDSGALFEYLVGKDVTHLFPGARVLFNVYVPKQRGGTSECDVIALIEGRMVVFECKCYSGWVFGKQDETYWVETFNSRSKNRFYNPIRQNAGHVKALSAFLGVEPSSLVSIVVFSNRADLKHVKTDGSIPVVKRRQLRKTIKKALDEPDSVTFNETTLDALVPLASPDEVVRKEHIESIKRRYDSKERASGEKD